MGLPKGPSWRLFAGTARLVAAARRFYIPLDGARNARRAGAVGPALW
jgi:hypothetical protein